MAKVVEELEINLDVKIIKYKPTTEEIQNYVLAQTDALSSGNNLTLNDYLKSNSEYKESKAVIVADLSNIQFHNTTAERLNLKGADFSGSIIKNTSFEGCDLKGAVFCDTDLSNAKFKNTDLAGVDFRGANLITCQFDSSYDVYKTGGARVKGGQVEHENPLAELTKGIKFGTTQSLAMRYANIYSKDEQGGLQAKQEQLIASKESEIGLVNTDVKKITEDRKRIQSDFMQSKSKVTDKKAIASLEGAYKLAYGTKDIALQKRKTDLVQLEKELGELQADFQNMQDGKFPERNLMDKSFGNVLGHDVAYDPSYARGSSKAERDQKRTYVALNKEQVILFLERIKSDQNLSINEFAKSQFATHYEVDPDVKYIADCSSSGNAMRDQQNNLMGLDFSNANLSGAVFAGADLRGCNFTGANLSNANFESANLGKIVESDSLDTRTIFENTIVRDANFFNSNLSEAKITNSDFKRAFMPRSNAERAVINGSNFDYADIKHGKWGQAQVRAVTFNHADMEGISLAGADIRKTQFQHAILNDAVLSNAQIIKSDFTKATMEGVEAIKSKWQDTTLDHVKAQKINLTEAELDKFVTFTEADLNKAILTKMNAEGANFVKANMSEINAEFADLTSANIEGAKLAFANLDGAVLDKVNAAGVDMFGATLQKAQAQEANFSKAILQGVDARKANFTGANFTEADLQNADFTASFLEQVHVYRAKVNANTNMWKVESLGAQGDFIEHNAEGEETDTKSIDAQKKQSEEIEKAAHPKWYQGGAAGKIIGGVAEFGSKTTKAISSLAHGVSNFMNSTLGPKWGKIAGIALGVALGIIVAITTVATAGIGGIAAMAIGAAIVGICAVVCGVAGHYAGNKIGVGSAIASGLLKLGGAPLPVAALGGPAIDVLAERVTGKNLGQNLNSPAVAAGTIIAIGITGGIGLPAIIAGAVAGKATDLLIEKITGQNLASLGSKALKVVEDKLHELSQNCQIDPKAREWLDDQRQCQVVYDQRVVEVKQSMAAAANVPGDHIEDLRLLNAANKAEQRRVEMSDQVKQTALLPPQNPEAKLEPRPQVAERLNSVVVAQQPPLDRQKALQDIKNIMHSARKSVAADGGKPPSSPRNSVIAERRSSISVN